MQIIFHIGQPKTASTAIQACLARNREQLAAQGVLYPRALGQQKAALLGSIFRSSSGLDASTKNELLSALRNELAGDYSRALISNETFFNTPFQERLKGVFGPYATSWRVLCYVRRPDEHMVSNYQQLVKGPHVYTFDRFFETYVASGYYRYAEAIDRWANVFGKESVEVRVFHRKTLDGSPVEDFTQWLGLNTETLSMDAESGSNESLDRINTELIRLLHLGLVERPELMQRHSLDQILHRLRSVDSGERVRLETARARFLQDAVRADHERLAERYLSPEHAAVLLAPPAEVPPYPPLDRDELAARITSLFDDPDLVRYALERAEQPSQQDTIPRDLIARPRKEVAASALKQFDPDPPRPEEGEDVERNDTGKAPERTGSLLSTLAAWVRRR
jgi:hypothetical protein